MPIIHRQHFISSSSENLSGTDENYSLEGPRYSPTLKPKAYSESQPSDAPCSPPGFGRPPENCITPSDESDASQTSRYEEEDYLTVLVPTAKAREKSIPPNSDGSPSSQEQPSKQQSNAKTEKLARRQALQTKVDEELLRVEEALALFRKRVTYEASSLAGWQRFEAELEEESEVLLNNLLWLYKKENGITNLGLNLEVILEGMGQL
jgi:hypothetical protein